jgi:hypothetical protein
MEVTKWLKPSISVSRIGGSAPTSPLRSYLKSSHSLRQVRVKMIAASRVDTIYRLGLVRTVAAGVR